MQTRGSIISEQVDRKLEALRILPSGPDGGRPLNLCEPGQNPATAGQHSNNFLRILFQDIGEVVGSDFVEDLDPALLEQFCIMSVHRNEPAGEVMRTLIHSFMHAYAGLNTTRNASDCLEVLRTLSSSAVSPPAKAD